MRIVYRIGAFLAALLCAMAVAVQPASAGVGMEPVPHPWLAGQRVQAPGGPAIYLIDPDGYRRWIPDPTTFDNLFRDWNGVIQDPHIGLIAERDPLTSGASLVSAPGRPVYLFSNGVRRWVTSPAAMDKYYFSWEKIRQLPVPVLDATPEGAPWG